MGQEGCHGTTAEVFRGVQAGSGSEGGGPRGERQSDRGGTGDWSDGAEAMAARIAPRADLVRVTKERDFLREAAACFARASR